MPNRKVDALVIGSGVGGLCVAARLVAEGLKVEVVEKLGALGGRFSTRDLHGCKVTTGAIMVPFGERSALHETFQDDGGALQRPGRPGRIPVQAAPRGVRRATGGRGRSARHAAIRHGGCFGGRKAPGTIQACPRLVGTLGHDFVRRMVVSVHTPSGGSQPASGLLCRLHRREL